MTRRRSSLPSRIRTQLGVAARLAVLAALAAGPAAAAPADVEGRWSSVAAWPMIPVHAALLPDGKVVTTGTTPSDTHGGFDFDVWDPSKGLGTDAHVTKPNVVATDSFCASQVLQAWSGEIMFAGGSSGDPSATLKTSRFSWKTRTLALAAGRGLTLPRWYSAMTTLPDGRVLVNGGVPAYGNADGASNTAEIYTPGEGWRVLPGTAYPRSAAGSASERRYWFPRAWPVAGDKVFVLSGKASFTVGYSGEGSISAFTPFGRPNWGGTSSSAMFAPKRIIQFGGGAGGDDDPAPAGSKAATVIDLRGAAPVMTDTASMRFGRHWPTATVLPTGEVLATGGAAGNNGYNYSDDTAALVPEIWNPATGAWRPMAAMQRVRLYHSVALLLPDGRVLSGGGGSPGPHTQRNAEIFSPPYLFGADGQPAARPVLESEPGIVGLGATVQVRASGASPIARFTLVKTGAVTHGVNMDQRFLELAFSKSGDVYALTMTADAVDATPGYYMLFAIDSKGVPSVARMLRVPSPTADNGEAPPAAGTETAGGGSGGGGAGGSTDALPPSSPAPLRLASGTQCLAPRGGSAANDVPMVLADCSATTWAWTAADGGFRLANGAGKCLDTGTASASGSPVAHWSCDGSAEQLWTLATESGGGRLRSARTGLCLDGSNGVVTQSACSAAAAAQVWTAKPAGAPTEPAQPSASLPPSGAAPLRLASGAQCLAPRGGSAANDTPMVLADCSAATWTWTAATGGFRLADGAGKCLDTGTRRTAGSPVAHWSCDASAEQIWTLTAESGGGRLRSAATGLCLDGSNGAVTQGTCSPTAAGQVWTSARSGASAPSEPSTAELPAGFATAAAIVAQHDGLCLAVAGASATNGSAIVQTLCGTGGKANAWSFEPSGAGFAIRSEATGKCVDVADASGATGAAVVQWSCDGSAEQAFAFRPRGSAWELVAGHSGLCLTVPDGSRASGERLVQGACSGAAGSLFGPSPPNGT